MVRQEKHNEHITTYLNWYLAIENPEFAVLIKGEWGSGKSYFIKKYIETKKDEKFIFVTLNGLSTIKEIDQQILSEVHPVFNNRFLGPVLKIGGQALAEKAGFSESVSSFDSKALINFDKEKYVFIFDDFERHCFEKSHTLMGFINSFVEDKKKHVILLSNEDEITKKEDEQYCRIKEKVIGQTLTVDTSLEYVFECLLSEMLNDKKLKTAVKIIQDNYDAVFDVIKKSNYLNFRVIRQSIQNFGRLCELIDNKYFIDPNPKFINHLLTTFFTLEIESRMGELNEEVYNEIQHGGYLMVNGEYFKDEKATPSMQKAHDLMSKYNLSTFFNTWVFELEVWRKWLFEGNINKSTIDKNLENSYLFKKETCISKMIEWNDITDNDFETTMNEIIEKLQKREITNPADIFLVYDRFIYFEMHGYEFSFKKSVNAFFTEYIKMLSQNNKLEEDYGFIHQGFTPKGDVDKYKKFRTDLIMSIEKKTFNKNKKRAKTLLTVMGENAEEAGKMICIVSDGNTERPVHLLEFLNVKEFVDCFNGIDNRKKRIIYSKIEERFKFIENRDWLLDEKDFVEKTINYIEKKIKGVKYSPSVFHLNQLLKTLEDSLKKMNSIKNDK